MIESFSNLNEAADCAYSQARNGTYVVVDLESGDLWSMAELIGGGFSNKCTEREHAYWKDWLVGNTDGVAVSESDVKA